MNTNLLNIVKQIIANQGEAILTDPKRLSSFLADLAQDILTLPIIFSKKKKP